MKPGWTIFLLSAFTFGIAFGAAWLLVPDVVPISHTDEPQAGWSVLTAFLLRAIELTAAWVALIALAVTLGAWTLKRSRQPLNRHPKQPAD
jgi:type II secretory pathway component PulF